MSCLSTAGMIRNAKGAIQDAQAGYATPLRFHVISGANLPRALEHYERTIAESNLTDSDALEVSPYTITTGNVSNALSDNGVNDVAYKLFESTDYAPRLYQGAASIWERRNGYTNELGFNGANSMDLFNHYSFGAVYERMMTYQLDIRADEARQGYQHFILRPAVGGTFSYARGSCDSAYGTISSGWTAADGALTGYDVVVPANTSATLYLPATGEANSCGGVTLTGAAAHNGSETTQFELLAGACHFEIDGDAIAVTQAK